jgi:hypothetical protein
MTNAEKQAGDALKLIVMGLEMYARAFKQVHDCTLGDDGVIGFDWAEACKDVIHMMNGPSGDVNRAELSGRLHEIAQAHGLNLDL